MPMQSFIVEENSETKLLISEDEKGKLSCLYSIKKEEDRWDYRNLFSNYIVLVRNDPEVKLYDLVIKYQAHRRIEEAYQKGRGSVSLNSCAITDQFLAIKKKQEKEEKKKKLETVSRLSIQNNSIKEIESVLQLFPNAEVLNLSSSLLIKARIIFSPSQLTTALVLSMLLSSWSLMSRK